MYGVSGCLKWVNGVIICDWSRECSVVMDLCISVFEKIRL